MEEKTYYDYLFTNSQREDEILDELNAERERYEQTEEYKAHEKRVDELFKELKIAGEERRKEVEKHKPVRRAPKYKTEEEMEEFRKKAKEEREKRIEALPEKMRTIVRAYEGFNDTERNVFRKETYRWEPDYTQYKNPKTTQKDMKELLEILVQTTIDFINERGLTDIYSVGFGADDLQGSAKFGEWEPCTDASIHVCGLGKENGSNGDEYTVVQRIGEYM